MLLSIVVPVYNVEAYLPECIASIRAQDFGDYEVIFVNDASPDNSLAILQRYADEDARVHIVDKEHGGLVAARKAGCKAAKGDYILALDSDDMLAPGLLSHLSDIIGRFAPQAVSFDYVRFSGEKRSEQHADAQDGLYEGEKLRDLCANAFYDSTKSGMARGRLPQMICGKAVARELYCACQDTVPDEARKGEDLLFTAHLLTQIKTLYVTHFAGYLYRINESSMTHDRKNTQTDIMGFALVHGELASLAEKAPFLRNQQKVRALQGYWHFALLRADVLSRAEFVREQRTACSPLFLRCFKEARIAKPERGDLLKQRLLAGGHWNIIYFRRRLLH